MTDLADTIKELRTKCFDTPMDGITWPIASSKLLPILDAAEKAERYEAALRYFERYFMVSEVAAPYASVEHRTMRELVLSALAPEPPAAPEPQVCEACGGSGGFLIQTYGHGCCGQPLRNGECCGNSVQFGRRP